MRAPSRPASVRGPVPAGAIAAVLTPTTYLAYVVAVWGLDALHFGLHPVRETAGFVLVIGVVGVLCLAAWRWRLYATPLVTALFLLWWPWFGGGLDVDYAVSYFPFVGTSLLLAAEAAIHRHRRVAALLDRPAVAVGLAHVLVGSLLQLAVRPPDQSLMWAVVPVVALVLFATGALPVVLWRRERLVAPALAAAGWFAWGVYGIWTWWDSLPLSSFTGIGWTAPVPHPDYALQSATLLLVVLVVAGLEYALRAGVRVPVNRGGTVDR